MFQKDKSPKWIKQSPKLLPSYSLDRTERFLWSSESRHMPRAKSEHDTAGPGINKVDVCFAVQRCVNFDAKCEQRILEVSWHFTCSRM